MQSQFIPETGNETSFGVVGSGKDAFHGGEIRETHHLLIDSSGEVLGRAAAPSRQDVRKGGDRMVQAAVRLQRSVC